MLRGEGVSHLDTWRKRIPGSRRQVQRLGVSEEPQVGLCQHVKEWGRGGRVLEDDVREVRGW